MPPTHPRIVVLHGGPVPVDYGPGGREDVATVDPVVLDNGDVVTEETETLCV